MQTMKIPPLCCGVEGHSQGTMKEPLGLEAALAPRREGRQGVPQGQHVRGPSLALSRLQPTLFN